MATNISKYVQLNDFLLLEYEFNKSGEETNLSLAGINSICASTKMGSLQYFNSDNGQGVTNNTLTLNSVPTNSARTSWYCFPQDTSSYWKYFDSSTSVLVNSYPLDTIKVHIVSGYNFDDVAGFLLQIRAGRSIPEIDKICLSGTSGSANISCNGVTRMIIFDASGLTTSAEDFVGSWGPAFLTAGVILSAIDGSIIFTSQPGKPFSSPATISNVGGTLNGTRYDIQTSAYNITDRDLANFTWLNQVLGNQVNKFSSNALFLGNRFYDKYVEFKIPSIQELGGDKTTPLGILMDIQQLSDVFITYSTIPEINIDNYIVSELISVQLPVTSVADDFNCLIAESDAGDFIEFFATWKDVIIGENMGDIESGRIKLYTSNNPNDNYQDFSDIYGAGASKWVIMHELQVKEHVGGGILTTQKYVFTQEDSFMYPNYFRPVLRYADMSNNYSIDYICRLMNRMDGTQIIRKASFVGDSKKYGRWFTRLNVENYIPYKVFNRIEGEGAVQAVPSGAQKTKFIKVFYDTTTVSMNMNNEILPQGTGPLFLRGGDGIYMFQFSKINTDAGNEATNVDLSGAYNYALLFILDDKSQIEISPTYSTNMNTALGQLEFKIMGSQAEKLLSQSKNGYSIIVKNPDGTQYTFYEGSFYSYNNYDKVISSFSNILNVTEMNTKITNLQTQVKTLQEENALLKSSK